jgi:putative transposon-encoded protein
MKKVVIEEKSELRLGNIEGFIKRKVTKFGTSAKVDCPKEYLGCEVYLVIVSPSEKRIARGKL